MTIKNSFELTCLTCVSSEDARCQLQMPSYQDMLFNCTSPFDSCAVILIKFLTNLMKKILLQKLYRINTCQN